MINKNISIHRGWWVFIAVVFIVRLYLTGDRDILALNAPHDEYWYIQNAFNGIWGGDYNEMTLIHLPIYSIWLRCLNLFGIPVRLAMDVGWLLANTYLAYAVFRLTRMAWAAALLFCFLAFHPYVFVIFDRALAETFLTVLSAVVLAAAIELWNCRDNRLSRRARVALIVYVFGFAIAYHTRTEGIVLTAPLLLLACWSIFDRNRWWRRGANKFALVVPFLLAPLLSTIILGSMLSAANYVKWGVWARQELAAPGYERAMAALSSIDAGPTPRQITVTQKMLSLAYRESPTLRELQPAMEGEIGQQWIALSRSNVGVPGEIGNGWFYWAFRGVAAHSGWHKNAKMADGKYAAAANELESAFASGRLKKRRMFSSFLDPDLGKWAPALPTSIFSVAKLVVRPLPQDLDLPSENASPNQFDKYTIITGRRSPPRRISVNGWVVAPAGSQVSLDNLNVTSIGLVERPDVPGAHPFAVSFISSSSPTELRLRTPDGRNGSVALSTLKIGATTTMAGDASVLLGIEGFESNAQGHRADRFMKSLCLAYDWLGYLICLTTLGAGVLVLIRRRSSVIAGIMLLMLTAIGARVALFGVVDASSWSGIQARYIMPILPFFACMGVCSFVLFSDFFRRAHLTKC